jgi:hypothetical protein
VLIFCPNCSGSLSERFFRHPQVEGTCPTCAVALGVTLFPALFRPAHRIDAGSLMTAEGDATCFEHTNKRAVALCNRCGRFLCALCEVELDGKVWCPSCLISGDSGNQIQAIEKQRTLFDSIALALALWPVALFLYPSIFTSPVVVYLSIRYWKKPTSIIPRSKWRFVAALIIALLELGIIVALMVVFLVSLGKTASVQK